MEKIEKLKLRNISAQRVGSDQGDAVDGIFTSEGIENGSGSDITFPVPVSVLTRPLISVTVTFYVIFGTYRNNGKEYYYEAE